MKAKENVRKVRTREASAGRVFTVEEAAPELGAKPQTVWGWCRAGILPHRRIGRGRNIRILREDIEAFLSGCAR